jgi:catechol 2,3-dioxygenase-like lactoylglutathione lyase family enzyme
MSAITDLFAGVPASDLDASIDWYTRFFGRPPDSRVGEEVLWEIDEHAWLFIEPNAARAGAGRITLAVAGLEALLERLADQRIEHEPIETYSNGVRHVNVPDPDGNAIAVAEPPDAASASSIGRHRDFVIDDAARPPSGNQHAAAPIVRRRTPGSVHSERCRRLRGDASLRIAILRARTEASSSARVRAGLDGCGTSSSGLDTAL